MKYALLGLKNMRAQNAPPAVVFICVKYAKWNIFQNVGNLYMQRMCASFGMMKILAIIL